MAEVGRLQTTGERPALQRRSREKRDRLVKAGFRVFARDGYEDARISDIARESGISIGAFYHRFGDKKGFFYVLLSEYTVRGMANWNTFFTKADPNWTVEELFERLVDASAKAISKNAGFFTAFLSQGRKDKAIAEPIRQLDAHSARLLMDHLQQRDDTGADNLDIEKVHFAMNSMEKILVMSSVLQETKYKPRSPETICQLARMMQSYLDIK
jgi:AcrR family transcriptional regulator